MSFYGRWRRAIPTFIGYPGSHGWFSRLRRTHIWGRLSVEGCEDLAWTTVANGQRPTQEFYRIAGKFNRVPKTFKIRKVQEARRSILAKRSTQALRIGWKRQAINPSKNIPRTPVGMSVFGILWWPNWVISRERFGGTSQKVFLLVFNRYIV